MNVLRMNMISDSNQDYCDINGGSPIQKKNIGNGSKHCQVDYRYCDQVDSCHSTSAQNQSTIHNNQINSKVNSNLTSQHKKKQRSSSILQASASSSHTNQSLLQGMNNVGMGNSSNNNNNNSPQNNISCMVDDLFNMDKEMLAEKVIIQNSLLKAEKNSIELELKKKVETIDQLEKKIEEIHQKYKIDIERKELLEIEQTILQKKINDIVNIYENSNNNSNDINSLKKISTELRAELNLKQMIVDKQKETIKQLQESNQLLQKNEAEIYEAQKKTQQIVDKFEIVNKDLQKFLKQSTEMQIKLRNQLMQAENNRQLLEEKYNLQTQRATILHNNNHQNMSINNEIYGSRASLMMNQEIFRLTKGSNEQSFAFGHLESINNDMNCKRHESVNNDMNFKRQTLPNSLQNLQQKDEYLSHRYHQQSINEHKTQIDLNQEEKRLIRLNQSQFETNMQNNDINKQTKASHSMQQQLQFNSLAVVTGFSRFQNSVQSNALREEELSNQEDEEETDVNLSLLSQGKKREIDSNQQPLDSARQQNNQTKFYNQLQNSQKDDNKSRNNLMSSLKEHILSLSENKDNLNEQLQEILKESKRGNDKHVKELMKKFESRLGQFYSELSKQAETLCILQQRLEDQDCQIETYRQQEEQNLKQYKETMLQALKAKYKKQIKLLSQDVEMLQSQKVELVKQFELQVSESYSEALREASKTFQMQIIDLESSLNQAQMREQNLEQQIKQLKDNSNQKQQRMLQRFKNNSISNTPNSSYNMNQLSNRNQQIPEHLNNADDIHNGGETYCKQLRESSSHYQTRDESEYKENKNSSNMCLNQQNSYGQHYQQTTSRNTYSPAPTGSINYLSSENNDCYESHHSGFHTKNQVSHSKSGSARSSILHNDDILQQQSSSHHLNSLNYKQQRQQQKKGEEQSIYSSRNYNLSPSSQQNQNENNSMEFSHASQQQPHKKSSGQNHSLNNNSKSNYVSENIHTNYMEERIYKSVDCRMNQSNDNNMNHQLSNQEQLQEEYADPLNGTVQIQKKLYDQFNLEHHNSQQQQQINYIKNNIPMIPHPQSQTMKTKSIKSHQALNSSLQLNKSVSNYSPLQDTFGQRDKGFHSKNENYEVNNPFQSNGFQEKQKQQGLTRVNSFSNLNSSRNHSHTISSCPDEYAESIHNLRDSKHYISQQNQEFFNNNQNSHIDQIPKNQQQQLSQFLQQTNQNGLIQLKEYNLDEYQKSSSELNAFNNFTFTQSQQNYNGLSDIEAYYAEHQQVHNSDIPQNSKEIQQQKQKMKDKPCSNKLQIITDTYDEHKLNQITSINIKNNIEGITEVNKSNSSQRIRSSSSNFTSHQQNQNSQINLISEQQRDQKYIKQTLKK